MKPASRPGAHFDQTAGCSVRATDLAVTAAIALASLLTAPAAAQPMTTDQLAAIREAVRDMCLLPDRAGDFIRAEGAAAVGAGVPVKVIKGNIEGQIKYEAWKGIPITLDKYKTDPRQCSVEVLRVILPAFTPARKEVSPQRKVGAELDARNQAFLLGLDVFAVAEAVRTGWNPSGPLGSIGARLRLLSLEPWNAGEKPTPEFVENSMQKTAGELKARSSRLFHAYMLGVLGSLQAKPESKGTTFHIADEVFELRAFAIKAGFDLRGNLSDSELLKQLKSQAER